MNPADVLSQSIRDRDEYLRPTIEDVGELAALHANMSAEWVAQALSEQEKRITALIDALTEALAPAARQPAGADAAEGREA